MRRREFTMAGVAGTAWVLAPRALAQQRLPRVGMLNPRSLETSMVAQPVVKALADLGYRDGKEIKLEYRSTEGNAKPEAKLVRELLDLKCDLIFALATASAARTFRDARSHIPIVFFAVDYDPVQKGIVDNLRHPGGNMTGVWTPVLPLSAKKLEIGLEVLPRAKRFLVLADVDSKDQLGAVQEAATKRSVELLAVEYTNRPYDVGTAFKRARDAKVDGFIGLSSPGLAIHRAAIAEHLTSYKLPAFVGRTQLVEPGFLVCYTTNLAKAARQVASVGVRILKGEKPGDVAVEQPDEFELIVNMKTAKALGVTIPYTVLARATKLIE
jgi:putative tryptophan/tyrosine transport system substrate-binding protein